MVNVDIYKTVFTQTLFESQDFTSFMEWKSELNCQTPIHFLLDLCNQTTFLLNPKEFYFHSAFISVVSLFYFIADLKLRSIGRTRKGLRASLILFIILINR